MVYALAIYLKVFVLSSNNINTFKRHKKRCMMFKPESREGLYFIVAVQCFRINLTIKLFSQSRFLEIVQVNKVFLFHVKEHVSSICACSIESSVLSDLRPAQAYSNSTKSASTLHIFSHLKDTLCNIIKMLLEISWTPMCIYSE